MADYRSYSYNSAGPSQKPPPEAMQRTLTRNSQYTHHSVADSTVSWVQNHGQPGRPPLHPQSIDASTVVQKPRPLPNPHSQASTHRPLRVVNVLDTPPGENEEHGDANVPGRRMEFGFQTKGFEIGNSAETSSTPSAGVARSQKKKRFVGGFVKKIRRLPKTVFGYGAGTGGSDRDEPQRSRTLLTDVTPTSATGTTTLPPYSSNPPTPSASAVPGRSGLRAQYNTGLLVPTEPPIPESPPPDVVRLSSNRVSVPSDNFGNEENDRLAPKPDILSRKSIKEFSHGAQGDRATVMLYQDPNSQYYEDDRIAPGPVPSALSRQPSSGPALSYVADPLPLQPVRTSSFHSSHTVTLPPLEIPKRVPTPGPNGPRVSYASQAPPRGRTPQSLIPGAHPSPPPNQLELQTVQPSFPQQANPPPQPTEDIQSPVTAHPKHTADYRKMTLSPSPTSHNTYATGSSYYDPSFSSQLNPVEKFFTTLYRMPWISHNRVTVDYLPGAGAGVRRKRKMKRIASWYRSVMSRSSRNSETIDVLSNGTTVEHSPRSNLRASLAMILGSPSSRRSSDRHRNMRHRSHDESKDSHSRHHHSSRRHHRRHHHSHNSPERRRTTTSTDTADKDTYVRTESSPLVPSMYPFQYPPYSYPSFPSFPVPAPVSTVPTTIGDEQLSRNQSKERRKAASPRGPRAVPQQSHMFYAPAPGYASYQPMIAPPPQVYFLQSPASPTYGGVAASVPPALVPGFVHENGHAHGVPPGGGQAQQQGQPAVVASGPASGQNVPGAFST